MKKLIKYFVVLIAFFIVCIGNVYADDTHVTSYADLKTAIQAKNESIILDSDLTATESITINTEATDTMVVDLNNHKITTTSNRIFTINGEGTVTIKNGTLDGTNFTKRDSIMDIRISKGTLNVSKVTIYSSGDWTIWCVPTGGDVHFNNGTIVQNKGTGQAMHVQDDNGESNATVHFNNAVFLNKGTVSVIAGPESCGTKFDFVVGTISTSTLKRATLFDMNRPVNGDITGVSKFLDGTIFSPDENVKAINGTVFQFGPSNAFKVISKDEMENGAVKTNGAIGDTSALIGYPVFIQDAGNSGYEIDTIEARDVSNNPITINNNQFTMPNSNVTISATFREKERLNVTINPSSNGEVVVANTGYIHEGERVNLNVNATSGYALKDLVILDSESHRIEWNKSATAGITTTGAYFTMPSTNVTISATFDKIINVTTNINQPGYGNVNKPKTEAFAGESLRIVVSPFSGYILKEFTVLDSSSNPVELDANGWFTVGDKDITITINFDTIEMTTLVLNQSSSKGLIDYEDVGNDDYGYPIYELIVVEEKPGYKFSDWNVIDENGEHIVVVNNRFTSPGGVVTVTPVWVDAVTYDITFEPSANGTLQVASAAYEGKVVTITPKPNQYYHLGELHVYKTSSHEEITVTNKTFVMPGEAVTIEYTMVEGGHITTFEELKTAINNKEEAIILDNDIEATETLTINTDTRMIIEFDNHTISSSNTIFKILGTGEVTLKNGILDGTTLTTRNSILSIMNSGGIVTIDNMNIFSNGDWTIWATPIGGDIYFQNDSIIENKTTNEVMHVQDDNGDSTATMHFNKVTFVGKGGDIISGPASCGTKFDFARGTIRTSGASSTSLFSMNRSLEQDLTGVTAYVDGVQLSDLSSYGINGKELQFAQPSKFQTVTIDPNITGGTVTTNQSVALINSRVYLTVTPDPGKTLESITIEDTEGHKLQFVNGEYFTMSPDPVTVTATFVDTTYKLTINQMTQYGAVSIDGTKFSYNQVVPFGINNKPGYKFVNFIVRNSVGDDVTSQVTIDYENKTITMPGYDISITPVFNVYVFNVHVEKTGVGTVTSQSGVAPGTKVDLLFTPGEGYKISAILFKDNEDNDITDTIGYNTETRTFTMPEHDVYVLVQFVADGFTITPVQDSRGKITVSATKASTGSYVTVNATANFGNKVTGYKIMKSDNTVVRTINGNSVKIQMPGYNIKVAAIYGPKVYNDNIQLKITGTTYNSIKLTYEKVNDASSYKIYRSTDNKKYTLVKTITDRNTTSFTNTGLKTGTKYYYKVQVVKGSASKYTNVVNGTPMLDAPKVTGYTNTFTYARITYTKVNGATGYYIYRSTSQNGSYSKIGTSKKLEYQDKKAANGRVYYYKVVAYKTVSGKKKAGKTSNIVKAQRLNENVAFTVTPGSLKNVITITKNSAAKKILVYRATSKSGRYTKVATLDPTKFTGNTITWTNTGLKKNKTYWYKLALVNANTSKYSAKKSGKVRA